MTSPADDPHGTGGTGGNISDPGGTGGTPRGPLVEAVAVINGALDCLASSSWLGAAAKELGEALAGLTRVQARLTGVQLQVAAEADRAAVGSDVGATSAAAWWACESRLTHRAARSTVRLGRDLDPDGTCPLVGAALRDGLLIEEQARVIVKALADLPTDLDPTLRELAEKTLVDLAGQHDAEDLRRLGRAVLVFVAPDVAEDYERKKLEDDERRAWEQVRFTMTDDGQGSTHGRFTIPTAQAHLLRKLLLAFLARQRRDAPHDYTTDQASRDHSDQARRDQPTSDQDQYQDQDAAQHHQAQGNQAQGDQAQGDHQPRGRDPQEPTRAVARAGLQATGQALIALIEAIPLDSLPDHGGINPTIVATLTLDQLTGHGGDANTPVTLDTGEKITAGQARRWACNAGIIPAVLDTASVCLDMGRRTRYFTPAQRLALAVRDKGCTTLGCDRPPAMCHAHHMDPWHPHGPSDLSNGRLLCGYHHRLIHDPTYHHHIRPDGTITFTRRT